MKKKLALIVMSVMFLLSGCGNTSDKENGGSSESDKVTYKNDVSVTDLKEVAKTAVGEENFWPDGDIPADILDSVYGVKGEWYDEFYAQMPMMMNVDTLIIIKAKEANIQDIVNGLTSYRETSIADTVQYPINIPKIQASQIQTYGNYVVFVQLGADITSNNEEASEEELINRCTEQNEKALKAIEEALKQ